MDTLIHHVRHDKSRQCPLHIIIERPASAAEQVISGGEPVIKISKRYQSHCSQLTNSTIPQLNSNFATLGFSSSIIGHSNRFIHEMSTVVVDWLVSWWIVVVHLSRGNNYLWIYLCIFQTIPFNVNQRDWNL